MLSPDVLDLTRLENFDPHGGREAGVNRRYCCPLCGDGKPKDAAHRCLVYHAENGVWHCKRCGESGKLRDFWDDSKSGSTSAWRDTRNRARNQRAQLSQLRPDNSNANVTETGRDWRFALRDLRPLEGTGGADYLAARGIPLGVAALAGVRFADDFYGRPAAVFPIRNRTGELVAAQGRHTDARENPKARTCGPKSQGVFIAPTTIYGHVCGPFDARSPGVVICEAPVDALSVAVSGFPALALVGINAEHTSGPQWLHIACGLKSVFPAFDADAAGDAAADAISARLATYGARCKTLRPVGAKDWNEVLCKQGQKALGDWLRAQIFPTSRVGQGQQQNESEIAATRARRCQLEGALGREAAVQAIGTARRQIEGSMNETQIIRWRRLPSHAHYDEVLCVALLNAGIVPKL